MNFSCKDRKEEAIYRSAGGGEKGAAAVAEWRKYIEQYSREMREYAREQAALRYLPKNEKGTATLPVSEDDYD